MIVSPTPAQHAVLCAWHTTEHPTVEGIATALGKLATGVHSALTLLTRDGHMTRKNRNKRRGNPHYAYTLTAKGIAAALAPCPAAPPPKRARPDRVRPKALPLPPAVPVATVSEPARPKPLRMSMTPAKAEPLPAVVLPAALQTFRGVKHPPMPHGYRKPKGAGDWLWCTTLASMGQVHT